MLGGTVSVDYDVRWCLVNILSGERFKDCETGLKVPLSFFSCSSLTTLWDRVVMIPRWRITVPYRSTWSELTCLMLISWVRIVLSAFARAWVWLSKVCWDGVVGGGGLDARVSWIMVCSALLVIWPISAMEVAIRSRVRCSNSSTDCWILCLVVRSWDSTNWMVLLMLVRETKLIWRNSFSLAVLAVSISTSLAIWVSNRRTIGGSEEESWLERLNLLLYSISVLV